MFFPPDLDEAAQAWAVNTLGLHITNLFYMANLENLKQTVFQHVFVDSITFGMTSLSFCSNFMKYLCGKILQKNSESIQDRIKTLFGDCGAGVIFESMAFDGTLLKLHYRKEYSMCNLAQQLRRKRKH